MLREENHRREVSREINPTDHNPLNLGALSLFSPCRFSAETKGFWWKGVSGWRVIGMNGGGGTKVET
jgi:hypothetical protein